MTLTVTTQTTERTLYPEGVVIIDPATGAPVNDDALSHAYAYNASGQLISDTATDGTSTWVKTYSYTGNNLTAETKWVEQ